MTTAVTSISADPQLAVSGLFTAGGAQADSRRTEYHFDGTDFATYASGKHQLSFGIDIPDISRRGLDDFTNRAGTYTFASSADFTAATPPLTWCRPARATWFFWKKFIGAIRRGQHPPEAEFFSLPRPPLLLAELLPRRFR